MSTNQIQDLGVSYVWEGISTPVKPVLRRYL